MQAFDDAYIRNFVPTSEAPYLCLPGSDVFLVVRPDGGKTWNMWTFRGKRPRALYLGNYPECTCEMALARESAVLEALEKGENPCSVIYETFADVVRHWRDTYGRKTKTSTQDNYDDIIRNWILPILGRYLPNSINIKSVTLLCKTAQKKGVRLAHRVLDIVSMICEQAFIEGSIKIFAVGDVRELLEKRKSKPFPAYLHSIDIGRLVWTIRHHNDGSNTALNLLDFALQIAARPGEVREAQWDEIDWRRKTWTIPWQRAKNNKPIVHPLTDEMLDIFRRQKKMCGDNKYVYGGQRKNRPISKKTIRETLIRLGFPPDEITPHGFRKIFATQLEEMAVRPDIREMQLSHKVMNDVDAVYNRSMYLEMRKEMLELWAKRLSELEEMYANTIKGSANAQGK